MGCYKDFDPQDEIELPEHEDKSLSPKQEAKDIIQTPEQADVLLQNYVDQASVYVNKEFKADPEGFLDQWVEDPHALLNDYSELLDARLGFIIDRCADDFIKSDPALYDFKHNPTKGADYKSPRFPNDWWDITTKNSWPEHKSKYKDDGIGHHLDTNRNGSDLRESDILRSISNNDNKLKK